MRFVTWPALDKRFVWRSRSIRESAWAVGCCIVLAAIGCGGENAGPPLVPVSGVVTLDGEPLTTGGSVSFRDTTGLVQPTGEIKPDGTFNLMLDGREGAPVGEYRIVVFASEPARETRGHGGLPRLIVHKKYTDPRTTPLTVEVKEDASPGEYDVAVTR